MQSESVEPFPDNWTYLRAELNWLDRVLSLAVARQRKEAKEVDRLARTRADRATSHWWKGLVSLEGDTAYDSPAEMPRRRASKAGYQQQMEAKIRASEQRGVCLGLPLLRHRLKLSTFEKNLVLMALAPEINRRYGQIYNYLQEMEHPEASGLPTVDLLLRILCRNDTEWQTARQCLMDRSVLLHYRLLEVRSRTFSEATHQTEPFLTRLIKLSDPLVNYLLDNQPSANSLQLLLASNQAVSSSKKLFLHTSSPPPTITHSPPYPVSWSNLILPPPLLESLQHICHQIQYALQIDEDWGFREFAEPLQVVQGAVILLTGAVGTGKTTAARAIAQTLESPLHIVDLGLLSPDHQVQLLQEIIEQSPTVLLLKSAHIWLGKTSSLPEARICQFLDDRQRHRGITLFSAHSKSAVKLQWRNQMTHLLEFPIPDEPSRLQLWQQAFPAQAPLAADIDWQQLAHQFKLTGGQIRSLAREAAFYAIAESPQTKLGMKHLLKALTANQFKPKK